MASYVESATLLLVDKSSANIKKINKELKTLFATANKLNNLPIKMTGLSKATTEVKRLTAEAQKLKKPIGMRVQLQGAQQVQSALNQLARNRRTSITGVFGTSGADLWGRTAGTALGIALHGAIRGIGREIVEALRVGGRAQDIAETRLDLLGLTPPERTEVDKAIDLVVGNQRAQKGGPTFNRQQTEQIMAESLPGLVGDKGKLNVDAAKFMVEQAASLIELQIATGIEAKQAIARAQDFIKAGISSQRIFDPATGEFSKDLATNFFNQMRRLAPVIGEEFTGPFVRTMLQNAPRLKGSMSDEALDKVLMIGEEDRTKIVTGLETLRNTLFDIDISRMGKQGQSLIDAGIRVAAGKKSTAGVEELKAEFAKDPFSIVDEVVGYMRREGLDPAKREDVTIAVGRLVKTARAGGALETLVNTDQEMKNQFAFLDRSTGSVAETQERLQGSLLLSAAKLQNAFDGLAGQLVRTAEPILLPVMDAVTKNIASLAEGKVPDPTAIGAMAASLAAAGAVAMPFGAAAGLTALTTGQGNQTQLLGAIAVNTAATAANTGFGGGMLGLLKLLGKGSVYAAAAYSAYKLINPDQAVAAEATPEMDALTDKSRAAAQRRIQLSAQMADKERELAAARQKLVDVTAVNKAFPGSIEDMNVSSARGDVADLEAEVARLGQTLRSAAAESASLTAQVDKALKVEPPPVAKKPLQTVDAIIRDWSRIAKVGRIPKAQQAEDVKWLQEGIGLPATGEVDDQTKQAIMEFQQKLGLEIDGVIGRQTDSAITYLKGLDYFGELVTKTGQPPIPTPRPRPYESFISDAGKRPDALMGLSPQVEAAIDGITTSGIQAAASISDGLATGGTSAGASIASAMSGVAPSIGATIAAAMRNAAASVNVNVHQTVAPDTGEIGAVT